MKNKDKFFFFGFGQTAKYLVNNLVQSKKKNSLLTPLIQKEQVLRLLVKKNLNLLSSEINFTIEN